MTKQHLPVKVLVMSQPQTHKAQGVCRVRRYLLSVFSRPGYLGRTSGGGLSSDLHLETQGPQC